MKKIVLTLSVLGLLIVVAVAYLSQKDFEPDIQMKLKDKYSKKDKKAVDHSKFAVLQQQFEDPKQVTEACEICHNMTAQHVMQGNHWNWERVDYIKGRGITYIGKKNAINNFCISAVSNEKSCAKCHIGYGIDDKGQGYTDSTNIDCLVCHDNSDTYIKGNNMRGMPDPKIDLTKIAQSVGSPDRDNCGMCHFYGGGGNNVKHGDLDMAMTDTKKSVDIHMGTDGVNMVCTDCHTTTNHNISGKVYSLSSMNTNRNACEDCHSTTPHKNEILNEHNLKVACQTCHIPTYAKENSTKMYWDWSTAGKLKDGQPYHEEDSLGNHSYLSIKGSFIWDRNVKPDYIWHNGTSSHYVSGDKIKDTTNPLVLNQLHGSYQDPDAKIIPVKIHLAKQPYDPINKILIQPKLYSDNPGEGAYWKDFNWLTASEVGMREVGLPFSGKVSFMKTIMYWPVNHQVSSAKESVKCNECHTPNNSRLAGLTDFYLPGRDRSNLIDTAGILVIVMTILGVGGHGLLRIYFNKKNIN